MDDPLVPKNVSGVTRLAVQIICALAVIFIFVAALLTFIEGGKTGSGGWIVVGAGFILTTSTTGVLVRWVMKNELEESKHFYLLVSQALALMVLASGFLAVIYATEVPTYYIGGAAGPIIIENIQPPRGGSLQIQMDGNASTNVNFGSSSCQSFLFNKKVSEGTRYSVAIKSQPSGSLCSISGGTGVASKNLLGNDGIRVLCQTAWLIGGIVIFSGGTPSQWPTGLILQNNQQEQIPIPASTGSWYFPTPVLNMNQYAVTILATPPSLTCTIPDKSAGVADSPKTDIQLKCTYVPTPAPPTKSDD